MVRSGYAYPATNKATGGPATEYVSRSTGKFVAIDNKNGPGAPSIEGRV
jgi:hypothetical protein